MRSGRVSSSPVERLRHHQRPARRDPGAAAVAVLLGGVHGRGAGEAEGPGPQWRGLCSNPMSLWPLRASNPGGPEARGPSRVFPTCSLYKDLPAKSSQFSTRRPTRLDKIKNLHLEDQARTLTTGAIERVLIADCFGVTSVWRSDIPFESTRVMVQPALPPSRQVSLVCRRKKR